MVETQKYSIDMKRLALGEARGFTASKSFIECCGEGRFTSGRFDGSVMNSEWGRLRLDIKTSGYCEYRISVFVSNSGTAPSASDWENDNACRRAENLPELLLHKIAGRYLWFRLDVNGEAKLYGGALYTFGETFEDYLPQIYRSGRESFSHRYLSVFFTPYGELLENMRGFGKNLDARNADDDFLPVLARWMGLGSLCGLISSEELRRFLLHGRFLSRYRGTRRAALTIAELLTGKRPVLLEQMKIHENTVNPYAKTYDRLYGKNNRTVLLIFFDTVDDNTCIRLQRLTDMFMPAGNISRLVVRDISTVLDGYTYLDYNARIIHNTGGRTSDVKVDEGFVLL